MKYAQTGSGNPPLSALPVLVLTGFRNESIQSEKCAGHWCGALESYQSRNGIAQNRLGVEKHPLYDILNRVVRVGRVTPCQLSP